MAEHSIVGRIVKEKSLVGSIDKGTGMGELPSAAGQSEFPMPAYSANGTDLASIQAAIAEKSGVEAPAFPDGWKAAVEGLKDDRLKNLARHDFVIASDLVDGTGTAEATQSFTADAVTAFIRKGTGHIVAYTEYLDEYTSGPWVARITQVSMFPLNLGSLLFTYPIVQTMAGKIMRVNSTFGLYVDISGEGNITITPRPYSATTYTIKAGNYRTTFYGIEV